MSNAIEHDPKCPQPTGIREQYDVQMGGRIWHVDIDTSLTPDDEWRSVFTDYRTLREMAGHIVWNLCIQRFSHCEGLYPEQHAPQYVTITPGEYNGIADPDE